MPFRDSPLARSHSSTSINRGARNSSNTFSPILLPLNRQQSASSTLSSTITTIHRPGTPPANFTSTSPQQHHTSITNSNLNTSPSELLTNADRYARGCPVPINISNNPPPFAPAAGPPSSPTTTAGNHSIERKNSTSSSGGGRGPSHDLPVAFVKGLNKDRLSANLPPLRRAVSHRAAKMAAGAGGGGGPGRRKGLLSAAWKRCRRIGCARLILCLALLSLLSWTGLWTANKGQFPKSMVPIHQKHAPHEQGQRPLLSSDNDPSKNDHEHNENSNHNESFSGAQDETTGQDHDSTNNGQDEKSEEQKPQEGAEKHAGDVDDPRNRDSENNQGSANNSDENDSSNSNDGTTRPINGNYNPRLPAASLPQDGQADGVANPAAPAPDDDASRRPTSPRPDGAAAGLTGDATQDVEWYKSQYEASKRNLLTEIEKAVQADRDRRGDEQKTLLETTLAQRVATEREALETEFEKKLESEVDRLKGDAQNTVTAELDRIFSLKGGEEDLNARIFDPDLAARMAKTKEVPLYGFKMCAILEGALFNPWVGLGPISGNLMTANPPRALAASMVDSLALKVHDNIMSWADGEKFDTNSVTRFACYMAAHGRNEYALMTDGMWLLHVNGKSYFPDLTLSGPGDATKDNQGNKPGPRYVGSGPRVRPHYSESKKEEDMTEEERRKEEEHKSHVHIITAEQSRLLEAEKNKQADPKENKEDNKDSNSNSDEKKDGEKKEEEKKDEEKKENGNRKKRRDDESKDSKNSQDSETSKDDKDDKSKVPEIDKIPTVYKHSPPTSPQTPRLRYKIAYLFLVHEGLDTFTTLVDALYDTDGLFLIHVDSKRSDFKRKVHEWLEKDEIYNNAKNIYVMPSPFNLNWGASSIVFAQLEGFFTLMDIADWDYVINVSGYDYPTRSTKAMHAILERDPGKVYIEHWTDPETEWRLERAFFLTKSQTAVRTPTAAPDRRFALDHRFRAMKHHQWMILPRSFVQHLRHAQDAHDLLAWSEHSWIPDENYFAMVALSHSSHWANKIVNDCKRFIFFENGAFHPIWLKDGDESKLEKGASVEMSLPTANTTMVTPGDQSHREYFFVRKVNSRWEHKIRAWMDRKREEVDNALEDEIREINERFWTN
ncbi:core-2/I-branching enzyme-domain-containing protein [Powellomyces hirtus]|nr:core-2/I-branching enzyme-domain-containing protein [Powellomyces hirtus]